MREALAGRPDERFAVPPGITTAPIDPRTGKRPDRRAGCGNYVVEQFIEGTEPSELCSRALHQRLAMPYPFQGYDLAADGSLMVPHDELERLLAQEQDALVEPETGELLAFTREGTARLPLTELAASGAAEARLPAALLEESAYWVGTDGRRARVVFFGDGPRRVGREGTDLGAVPFFVPGVSGVP
jgi:hypothetical protein